MERIVFFIALACGIAALPLLLIVPIAAVILGLIAGALTIGLCAHSIIDAARKGDGYM